MEADVRLLGPPAVRVGGGAWVPLRPGRADAVLAYVARRGAPVRRTEVAALLWPDLDGRRASANLRQTVRTIATGPFEPVVGRDRERVWLDASCDVARWEAASRAGRWRDVVDGYRGTFLAGFELDDAGEFASWLESERSTLLEQWRHACLAVIMEADQRGEHAESLRVADLVLRFDPLDEVVVRHALRASNQLGDRAATRRRFDAVRTLLAREIGVVPEASTVALVAAAETVTVRAAVAHGDRRPPHTAVPTPASSVARRLIGRADLLDDLRSLLIDGDARLVTLLATGGMGKSMVAAAFVESHRGMYPNGVIQVDLEGVQADQGLVAAIAAAAGIERVGGVAVLAHVVTSLAPLRALLVLDGAERHLDDIAVVDALLRHGGPLRLLVTSRERLRHTQETVVDVLPLATRVDAPLPTDPPRSSDAARLFLASAARHRATDVALDADVVERVAQALGGLPLAIDLAAAWTDVMSPSEILAEVTRDWELLVSEERDRPVRHTDVGTMIEEHWRRLDPIDRAAFARLAAVPGSLDRTLAMRVAGTGWRGLRRLLDRAVVQRQGERVTMHALLARFGRQQAALLGVEGAARDALLAYWRAHAASDVDPTTGRYRRLAGDDLTQALDAWRRALERREWDAIADVSTAVMRAARRSNRYRELQALIDDSVAALERARGSARNTALALLLPEARFDTFDQLRSNVRRAWALARRPGADDRAVAAAEAAMLFVEPGGDDHVYVERAREALERAGDLVGLASLLDERSFELAIRGHDEESVVLAQQGVDISRRIGDRHGEAFGIDTLVSVPLIHGDAEVVRRGIAEADALFVDERASQRSVITLATEAWLCGVIEEHERALEYAHAFIDANRAYVDDVGGFEATMLMGHALRAGDFDTALRYGERLLHGRLGADRADAFCSIVRLNLAYAHLGKGDAGRALREAEALADLAAALDAPRIAGMAMLGAAAVALRLDERTLGIDLLRACWRHPAFDRARRNEGRDLVLAAGLEVEMLGPGPGPGPHDDVAALLATIRSARSVLAAHLETSERDAMAVTV